MTPALGISSRNCELDTYVSCSCQEFNVMELAIEM